MGGPGARICAGFSLIQILLAGGSSYGLPDAGNSLVLAGFGALTTSMSDVVLRAIITGAAIFLLLTGLRALLRYDWVAAIVAATLLTLQEGGFRQSPNPYQDLPIYIVAYGVLAFALLRTHGSSHCGDLHH